MIKKRNNIAEQLILLQEHQSSNIAFLEANNLIKKMHGVDLYDCVDAEEDNCEKSKVELYTDEKGVKWVHVKAWDEDFLLSLHDMRDSDKDRFMWHDAMCLAKSQGQYLPSKKQWMIIDTLREQIDKIIKDNDGDKLERWYWSRSVVQYDNENSWFYNGYTGIVYSNYKCGKYGGRSIVYLS